MIAVELKMMGLGQRLAKEGRMAETILRNFCGIEVRARNEDFEGGVKEVE